MFLLVQGAEWMALLGQGLTLASSAHSSFFYLIVGTHAVHAAAAVIALTYVAVLMFRNDATPVTQRTVAIFWYFVVGVWPIIFLLVYL